MDKAKRARTAETPKQPSPGLQLRAPYLYPDQSCSWRERNPTGSARLCQSTISIEGRKILSMSEDTLLGSALSFASFVWPLSLPLPDRDGTCKIVLRPPKDDSQHDKDETERARQTIRNANDRRRGREK
jgi:hypothetical protein